MKTHLSIKIRVNHIKMILGMQKMNLSLSRVKNLGRKFTVRKKRIEISITLTINNLIPIQIQIQTIYPKITNLTRL